VEPDILYRGYMLSITARPPLWRVAILAPGDNDLPAPQHNEAFVTGTGRDNVIDEAKRRVDVLLDG